MARSLSNLVNNLAEGIHKLDVKTELRVVLNTQTLKMVS